MRHRLDKMSTKRKRLSLKEKNDVLDVNEKEKLSVRNLAERFHVGKTQISELLKDKDEIRKMWILNSNKDLKNLKFRKTETSEIDEVVMKWFRSARAKNIPVSGVLLQEKAREIGETLGLETFKASNGWLEKFRIRHNISFKSICGEEKSVDLNDVTDWIEKLKSVCKGYDDKNIFNADETGLFYRVLPDKTLCFKGEKCSGGKISKERLTVLLCCNMLGEFETPLVIGKAKKPRCFKNIDVRKLGVSWNSNKKAWMTTDIMSDWLVDLDKRMKKKSRNILLFLDNATSHPDDLKLKNVKLVFLPPNATSVLQPLDLGIIRSFKVGYRKLLLRHVLSQISSCKSSEELAKSVSVLDAINWTTAALKKVEPGSVLKCFKKAGFTSSTIEEIVVQSDSVTISEANEKELTDLVTHLDSNVSVEEYVEIDNCLCIEEEDLDISNYVPQTSNEKCAVSEDDDEDEIVPVEDNDVPQIKDFAEALRCSQQLNFFFLRNGDSEGLSKLNNLKMYIEKQVCSSVKKRKQTVLTDYFK